MFLKQLLHAIQGVAALLGQILAEQKAQTAELQAIKTLLTPPPATRLVLTLGEKVPQ